MALDLGDLVGKISLEDNYTDTIDKAEKKNGSFGKNLGKMAAGVGIAMAAVGTVVAVGVGSLVKAGLSYNSEMETYRTNLGTLLGSAESAKKMMGDLSSFAAATPFEMPSLADAAQTLLSFGSTAEDLMPDLKMLGDISLGNSEKFSGLSLVFGQVQSAGRLMGQDVLQMINQGFNPLVEISKMTGESMVDLKKRMEDGGVSFEEVKAAMQHATQEGGQFFNAMESGSKTTAGQISTLKDGMNILSGAITGELSDAITSGALPAINDMVGGLIDMINGVDGADAAVEKAAGNLATSISTQVGPAIEGITGSLGKVVSAIAPSIGNIAVTLVQSLAAVIPSLISVAGQIILALVTTLIAAAPQMVEAATPAIMSLVMGLMDQIPLLIDAGLQIIIALAMALSEAVPELIPAVIDMLLGIVDALLDNISMLLDAALLLLMGLAEGLLNAIPQLIAKLPDIIVAIIDFLISSIPLLIDAGIELLISLVKELPVIIVAIVKAIPKIINGILDALITALPQLIDAGVDLFIALIDNLPLIIMTLINAVPDIIKGLVDTFTSPETLGKLADAGMSLLTGLWDGLKKVWTNITRWWNDTVGGLVQGFKDMLGIHSPSTVFKALGVNIGEGLIEGLDDIKPEIDQNVTSMVDVPSTSDVSRGRMGSSSTDNTKHITVIMEANRSTLDEEAIYEALGSPRVAA